MSDYNLISSNKIFNNRDFGVKLQLSLDNVINKNDIKDNGIGVGVYYCFKTKITENNFHNNEKDGSWQNKLREFILIPLRNKWDSNYWNEPRTNPKPIKVYIYLGALGALPITVPWPQFDWNPAQEPYDI